MQATTAQWRRPEPMTQPLLLRSCSLLSGRMLDLETGPLHAEIEQLRKENEELKLQLEQSNEELIQEDEDEEIFEHEEL